MIKNINLPDAMESRDVLDCDTRDVLEFKADVELLVLWPDRIILSALREPNLENSFSDDFLLTVTFFSSKNSFRNRS